MATITAGRHGLSSSGLAAAPAKDAWAHLAWFGSGALLGFGTPFIFTSVLSINHDVYYGIYFAVVLGFLSAYVAVMRIDVAGLFRRNWRTSLVLGVISAAFLVGRVVSLDGTDGPSGGYAAFEVAWRGLAYGVVDALLLTAFPGVVALGLLKGRIAGPARKVMFAALMLPMVLIATGAYHLGYEQFREDGIGNPELGNAIISVPMLATANPLGSIFAHASMHVAADVHVYETDVYLPPQTDAP